MKTPELTHFYRWINPAMFSGKSRTARRSAGGALPHIIITFISLFVSFSFAQAQVINSGSAIENSSEIYIPGDYIKTDTAAVFNNAGRINIHGNLINQTTGTPIFEYFKIKDGDTTNYLGEVIFWGDSLQRVISSYTGKETFHSFIIEKSDNEVQLDADIFIGGELQMNSENLFLNSRDIQFEFDSYKNAIGTIENESIASHVYDDSVGTGVLYGIVDGLLSTTDFDDKLGVEIKSPSAASSLRIERRHYTENEVSNGSINRVFRIVPQSASDEDVAYDSLVAHYFDFDYNAAQKDEDNFGPWLNYGSNTRWQTGWKNGKSQRDPIANFVTGAYNQVYGTGKTVAVAEVDCSNPPPLKFPADTIYLCEGNQVELKPENDGGLEYLWNTGSTEETITVDTEGWYFLSVWGIDGCTNQDSVYVNVKPIPEAGIGFYDAGFTCYGNELKFKNKTDIYANPATTDPEKLDTLGHIYTWKFHDGASSGQESHQFEPVYNYRNQGTFYPQLIVSSRYGCKDTAIVDVRILEIPKAKFVVQNLCQDDTITINHLSDTKGKTGTAEYSWKLLPEALDYHTFDYDDLPEWTLQNGGAHQIRLVASLDGCSDTTLQAFTVNKKPEIDFSLPATSCAGHAVSIVNNTVVDSGFVTYSWKLGNGESSSLKNPTVTYQEDGDYTVSLTATSGEGCSVSDSSSITVMPLPNTEFSISGYSEGHTGACSGDTVQFDILHFQNTYTYTWDVDGQIFAGVNPLRIKLAQGSHTISLTASSPSGCSSGSTQNLEVYPLPQAGFAADDQCFGQSASFVNASTIAYGTMSYLWKFEADKYSTARNPKVDFETPGAKNVFLEVTSDNGCQATANGSVAIIEAPELDIPSQMETCGNAFHLTAGPAGYEYLWSDNSTSNNNVFTATGSYWVKVSNDLGCSSRADFNVALNKPLHPSLGTDSAFCGSARLDAGYPGSTYLWSDGSSSRYLDVDSDGYYSVDITDQNGCVATAGLRVTINDIPQPDLGEDIDICANEAVTLDAGVAATYLWSDNSTARYLNVTKTGLYGVEVTSAEGCSAEDYIYIKYNGNPELDIPATVEACDIATLDAGEGFSQYHWSTGQTSRIISVTESGTIQLSVKNTGGCPAAKTINVVVNESPVFDLGDDVDLCYGNSAYLVSDYSGEAASYFWSTEEISKSIFANTSGEYTLTITTPAGCSATDQVNVNIRSSLTMQLPAEKMICRGQDGLLHAGEANASNHYQWFHNGAAVQEGSSPDLAVSDAGWYKVIASNDLGCSMVDSVRVFETTNEINAEFLVASTANTGDSLQFIQLTSPEPKWYQWHMGNGYKTYDYHPQYVYYVEGEYEVSLIVSNDVCLDTATKVISIKPLRTEETQQEKGFDEEQYFLELLNFNVYPNPTTGKTAVDIAINKEAEVYLVLYNLNGVKIDEISAKGKEVKLELDLHGLTNGIYILRGMINGKIPVYRKIIKM